MNNVDIKSMYEEELKILLKEMGEKPFRAGQLFSWMHEKRVESYDQMLNIPKSLREKLGEQYSLTSIRPVHVLESKSGDTRKYLFALQDGNIIESVWMKYRHGNSVCISSQVGCRMGCQFCASTLDGLVRPLQASEMLDQIYEIQRLTGERVSNIDIMGSGEPMDNFDNVVRFIRLVSNDKGINISQRNITVSTCGLVPQIRAFAEEKLAVTLAISLHNPINEERRELMPVGKSYSVDELMAACRDYFDKTGRRITFEYALIEGNNDSDRHAEALARLVKGMNCHINLIPVNPVKERNFRRSDKEVIRNFQNKLEKYRINVTIRREMGYDIDGACGQLRKRYISSQEEKPF